MWSLEDLQYGNHLAGLTKRLNRFLLPHFESVKENAVISRGCRLTLYALVSWNLIYILLLFLTTTTQLTVSSVFFMVEGIHLHHELSSLPSLSRRSGRCGSTATCRKATVEEESSNRRTWRFSVKTDCTSAAYSMCAAFYLLLRSSGLYKCVGYLISGVFWKETVVWGPSDQWANHQQGALQSVGHNYDSPVSIFRDCNRELGVIFATVICDGFRKNWQRHPADRVSDQKALIWVTLDDEELQILFFSLEVYRPENHTQKNKLLTSFFFFFESSRYQSIHKLH